MKKLAVLASLAASLALGGCSVFMAAQKSGEEAKTVQACQNKNCFLQLRDTDIIDITKRADGTETVQFKTRQQSGSAARAVGHAAADVFTLGLWEVVGTPTEAIVNKNRSWFYSADFDRSGRLLKLNFDPNSAANTNGAPPAPETLVAEGAAAAPVEEAVALTAAAPAAEAAAAPAEAETLPPPGAEAPADAAAPADPAAEAPVPAESGEPG